jgi:UDP-N-acetylglucosamine 4-epimerase
MEEKIKAKLKNRKYTWLITGSSGFIGTNLVKKLVQLNQNVIGVDIKKKTFSSSNYKFIKEDIKNIDCIKKKINKKIHFILHQAALVSVPDSIKNPEPYLVNNVLNFRNILELSRFYKIKNLVYASSSSVYGDKSNINHEENIYSIEQLNKLTSPYAQSKRIIEEIAKNYKANFNLIGLRYFNVFGEYQKFKGENLPVIANWINFLIKKKKLTLYGDGKTSRNFIYVDDVVNSNIISALIIKKNTILNICSSKSMNLRQLYFQMKNVYLDSYSDYSIKVNYLRPRNNDIKSSKGSNLKSKKLIYFKEALEFKKALAKTLEWQSKSLNLNS